MQQKFGVCTTLCGWPRGSRTVWRVFILIPMLVAAAILVPATAYADEGIHVVQRGESLGMIAQRYNVSVNELISTNGVTNPNIIVTGQRLLIPGSRAAMARYGTPAATGALPGSGGYYSVQRGDTLSQVAKNHGMSLEDLLRLNGLNNPNFIWTGQKLRVTARVAPIAPEEDPELALANRIYVVRSGDSLSGIAKDHGTTTQDLLMANGLPNPNFVFVGQRLRVPAPTPAKSAMGVAGAPVDGRRWIEVNLTNQTLTAWQGDVPVLHTSVSTGTSATPTVTGRFQIGTKYTSQHMSGPGYSLPNVPWVMYFYSAYAIHGAYWHNNFGVPMSHGCVNMRPGEAEMLFKWASPGTEVYVHY